MDDLPLLFLLEEDKSDSAGLNLSIFILITQRYTVGDFRREHMYFRIVEPHFPSWFLVFPDPVHNCEKSLTIKRLGDVIFDFDEARVIDPKQALHQISICRLKGAD